MLANSYPRYSQFYFSLHLLPVRLHSFRVFGDNFVYRYNPQFAEFSIYA
jgi:hypothetical protein